jgi:hypothetical protein
MLVMGFHVGDGFFIVDKRMKMMEVDGPTLRPRNLPVKPPVGKTGADRCRAYRERLKEDEERYKEYRQDECLRLQVFRLQMTQETREKYNLKTKERMRDYRARLKAQKAAQEETSKSKKKKKMTRREKEKKRADWRNAKRAERASWTSQKRRRVNEKRRERYALKKALEHAEEEEEDIEADGQLEIEEQVQFDAQLQADAQVHQPDDHQVTDNAAQVPVENADPVPVDNAGQVAVDNAGQVPVDNVGEVAVDNAAEVPVDNSAEVPVDNAAQVPVDNAGQVPVDNAGQVPVDDAAQVPVDNAAQVPVDNSAEVPVDNAAQVPVDNAGQVPVDNAGQVPVDAAAQVPVDNAAQVPVDNAAQVPVDNAAQVPVDNAAQVPVDNAGQVPVDDAAQVPVDNAAQVPVDNAGQVPVDDAAQVPVDNAAQVPVDNAAQVPVDNAGQVPVDNAAQVPVDNVVDNGYKTGAAKRKAVSRVRQILPNTPEKFSEVISRIISSATPKKVAALKTKMIYDSPESKKRLNFLDKSASYLRVKLNDKKKSRKKTDVGARRALAHLLTDGTTTSNSEFTRKIQKTYNISHKVMKTINKKSFATVLEQRKKRKDSIPLVTRQKILDFYSKRDLSRVLPCTGLIPSKDGANKPKLILECSLMRLYKEFVRETEVVISFSKFASFRPKNVMTMSNNKFINCLCEYCTNLELKLQVLPKIIENREGHEKPKDKYDLANETMCAYNLHPQKPCLDRKCPQCGIDLLTQRFPELLGDGPITWGRWEKVPNPIKPDKKKLSKISKTGTVRDMTKEMKEELKPFTKHLFDAKWQHDRFKEITLNPPKGWLVFCIDYAENYACQFQDESQSAHWAYIQVTVHPVVGYYHCPVVDCDKMVEHSLVMVSEDKTHDSDATQHYLKKAVDHMRAVEGLQITRLLTFSDGAPSHYKNRINFADLSNAQEELGCTAERNFFGARHGKGPCDRETGTIKKSVVMAVKCRRAQVSSAEEFYNYCSEQLSKPQIADEHCHFKRNFFFTKAGQIDRKSRKRNNAKQVEPLKNTRLFHQFISVRPNLVRHRERTCFCPQCISGDYGLCRNEDIVGRLMITNLSTGKSQRDSEYREGHDIEHNNESDTEHNSEESETEDNGHDEGESDSEDRNEDIEHTREESDIQPSDAENGTEEEATELRASDGKV